MKRRLAALVVAPFLLLLVGCSQIQDAATDAASDAASQAVDAAQDAASDAAAQAASAAADAVQQEVCSIAADGQISEQDQQTLAGLLVGAEVAGVPAEFITPLKDIADAGDQLPVDALTALSAACGTTPTATPAG